MKVKCVSDRGGKVKYRMTIGKEYVVLGMSISTNDSRINFWIKDDPGNYFIPTPSDMFEVVDSSVSQYWSVLFSGSVVSISAKEFLDPGFLGELTDFDEKAVATFKEISSLIENEGER